MASEKKLWTDYSSDEECTTTPVKPPRDETVDTKPQPKLRKEHKQQTGAAEPRRTVDTKPQPKPRKEHKQQTGAEPRRTVVTEPPANPRQRRDQKSTEPKKEGQCPFCAFATHSNAAVFSEGAQACCCEWCYKSGGRRHGERCEGIKF